MASSEPSSRRYAHSEGTTHLSFDNNRHLVTCGHDSDVRIFSGIEEDSSEFTVTTETVSAVAPYTLGGRALVAVATDNHSVQAFTREGVPEGLLVRFTSPVTYLSLDHAHHRLAASSCDFTVRVIQLDDITQVSWLRGHEAPVLCAKFDPRGKFLASSSCDGSIRIWDPENENACVKQLQVLHKCSDVSLAKSLGYVSWQPPGGKLLAVPVATEVRVYEIETWNCVATLKDDCHKESLNVVSWRGCGQYLACAGVDGVVSVWDYTSRTVTGRYRNESGVGITSLEWYPDTNGTDSESESRRGLYFADKEGYIGWFQGAEPGGGGEGVKGACGDSGDPLAEDSLLMEGIPPDAIFGIDDIMDDDHLLDGNDVGNQQTSGSHGNRGVASEEGDDGIGQSRKRRRLLQESDSDGEADSVVDDGDSLVVGDGGHAPSRPKAPPTVQGAVFNEKLLEVYQSPLLPSSTPHTLSHHFLTYNMVGVARSHSNDDTSMIEVEFHNSTIHHSFSLPNHNDNSMAALSEACLVLACQRSDSRPSQLQCVNFSSWDAHKDWTLTLPSKESATGLSLGNGWIAVATDKQLLRVLSLGGMQRDVISVAGVIVGVAGWGPRLAVIYQEAPCTENVFQLRVWLLDVKRRKQLSPAHSLPVSLRSKLEWFGFSEKGYLLSYDTKGIVRMLDSAHYGGSSWIPILDTSKQVGNKSDHYFLVGMTHEPNEIRAVLCKGLQFPPVHPKPVMTVVPIHLPLCDPASEQTQLEEKYFLQEVLLGRDTVAKSQSLMKLFALACKADFNYRSLEIAELMDDDMTLNLALTYASRTQHHVLARNISELIQKRAGNEREGQSSSHSESESEDVAYSESRTSALKQGVQSGNGTKRGMTGSKRAVSSLRIKAPTVTSKFEKQSSRLPNTAHSTTSKAVPPTEDGGVGEGGGGEGGEGGEGGGVGRGGAVSNETRELFSDDGEEEGGEEEGEGEGTPVSTPLMEAGGTKRSNPFKMTTPEVRRIQTDRTSSFLDNIGERTELERERGAELKRRRKEGGGPVGRGGRGGKLAKKSTTDKKRQSSLTKTTPTATPTGTTDSRDTTSARDKLTSFAYKTSESSTS